jgi:hypothetical protein
MGLSAKEAALLLLEKAVKLNPKWSATIDGVAATVNSLKIVAGPITKFEIDLADKAGNPVAIEALHPLVKLGSDEGDDIVVNGLEQLNDDVDMIAKVGFPRTTIKFQFEYGETAKQHSIVLTSKVNLISFILA